MIAPQNKKALLFEKFPIETGISSLMGLMSDFWVKRPA